LYKNLIWKSICSIYGYTNHNNDWRWQEDNYRVFTCQKKLLPYWLKSMTDEEMIQHLQDRFGLSKVQANVIFFKLEDHFKKNKS